MATAHAHTPAVHTDSTLALPVDDATWHAALKEFETVKREDAWLLRDLRSDLAGEIGAVWIYVGVRAAHRFRALPPVLHEFATQHEQTERGHLVRLLASLLLLSV